MVSRLRKLQFLEHKRNCVENASSVWEHRLRRQRQQLQLPGSLAVYVF